MKPKDNILYHYCDELVLNSILTNNEIWLSDINYMNDSTELKWARELFIKILKDNKDKFTQEFRFDIINSALSIDKYLLPLIGCFSMKKDLLSQWRAYANDGNGFSIGFSSKLIYEGLGVNIKTITYNHKEQEKIILNNLIKLFKIWEKDESEFSNSSLKFAVDLNYLKNPYFEEEAEVRIVRLIVKKKGKFTDIGGNSKINKIEPLPVLERERNGDKIRYIKLPIEIPSEQIIKEIIIGPKSNIKKEILINMLNKNGIENVNIIKSKIPYR
ncbi:DUF2971 domain-containing protein [Polaribacter vadi]|uniref:DUF2971 domain-containing protein n=1 Tax=Polaribacter vadi TaxID=1774273 RepID=UPI0030ECD1A6|tara:strand:+ start:800 stop:1615 length:816 start_codon:yes stop_codon:yes gene_type:complete